MIPQFTAERSLTRSRTRPAPQARRSGDRPLIVPQQRIEDRFGPLEATPHTVQCPGCWTHRCGFLGMSTCLTCC
jgi:hypothetical protein